MAALTEEQVSAFRQYVPPPGHPRVKDLAQDEPYSYSKKLRELPEVAGFFGPQLATLDSPFHGITSDGTKLNSLYTIQDEGAPAREIVAAAITLLDALDAVEKAKTMHSLDSGEWRKWCNPEIIFNDVGIRMEYLEQPKVNLIMDLLKASLSDQGYAKARAAMKTNKFLGEICNAKPILNEYSYFFAIFGVPSETHPWGFTFFGHHLCLNIFILGNQMTIGPQFIGAEPNMIDMGRDKGIELCTEEANRGLEFMLSLSPELRDKAQIYAKMHDPAMPAGRWHPADQRHLGGCFQDNRVIPYEGVVAAGLSLEQQEKLMELLVSFLETLPPSPLSYRLRQIRAHLKETYFSWIGGYGPEDPFYYRIQSPVVLVEFDHHSGIFLLNKEPAKYHIHTIVRMPNGNDYGRELLRMHRSGGP